MNSLQLKITVLLLFATAQLYTQNYVLYSNDSLSLYSEALQDSLTLNIHKPETFNFAASSTKYPVTIVFDSQHKMTYPKIVHSFDLLTNEASIPATLIVGIPFNYKNRLYRTSAQKKENDSLTGLDRMENFLFEELIPLLKKDYKANDHITLIGHSRTAFLVNYLLTSQTAHIDNAIALSGFYQETPLKNGYFENVISNDNNFKTNVQYFASTGTTIGEENYKRQYDALDTYLKTNTIAKNLKFNYTNTINANHITNYWMSVPQALLIVFDNYGQIIDDWLFVKLENKDIKTPIDEFKKDLSKLNQSLNLKANPSVTHIFSFASFYYHNKDFKNAISFLQLGLEYYPDYLDFYPFLIECYDLAKDEKNRDYYTKLYKEKINASPFLTSSEKKELLKTD
jgi:enterochelin esterase-like enzyme